LLRTVAGLGALYQPETALFIIRRGVAWRYVEGYLLMVPIELTGASESQGRLVKSEHRFVRFWTEGTSKSQ
ncbi:MAG: hypothetical protein ND866_16235, partial [Pyrinomonadaceae bacterium]|nr:hypothetical protein [Pyrinomonadaceae bacterium]